MILDQYSREEICDCVELVFEGFMLGKSLADIPHLVRVIRGFCYPVRPFIKNEGHPLRKLTARQFRIVNETGIVPQTVDRMLFGDYTARQAMQFPMGPCAVGIGFSDSLATEVGDRVAQADAFYGTHSCSSDIKGWDRSVSYDTMLLALEAMKRGCVNMSEEAGRLYDAWLISIVDCIYVMPNGELRVKWLPSLMPSGTYPTTVFNGLCRLIMGFLSGALEVYAQGDDCLEWRPPGETQLEMVEKYARLGVVLREVKASSADSFVLCSHRFYHNEKWEWFAELCTWEKALFHFLMEKAIDPDKVRAIFYETRHNSADVKAQIYDAVVDWLSYFEESVVTEAFNQALLGAFEGAFYGCDLPSISKFRRDARQCRGE